MEIRKVFGGSKEDIKSGKYNIFIGISLGNKWFTKDNLRQYLRWALDNSKDMVLFLIADEIHAINYNVRSGQSKEKNLRKALNVGMKMKGVVIELIEELSDEEQKKVNILNWKEYRDKDLFCEKYRFSAYDEFNSNPDFKKSILNIVKKAMTDRDFSDEDYLEFSRYLLEEFVSIYSGVSYSSVSYEAYPYPFEGELNYFIDDIQNCKIFSELNKKLPEQKAIRVVLN